MGDCALIENKPYPPIAQVADQQAGYLAKKVFNKKIMEQESCPDFHYMHKGSMAQIGRERAVVDTRNAFSEDLPGGKNTSEHFNPKGKAGFIVWMITWVAPAPCSYRAPLDKQKARIP